MPRQIEQGRRWYAIHTYAGYEENVATNLRQRIESFDLAHKIFNVLVPTEKRIKFKGGKRRVVTEKMFPGYVLVEMIVDDDSWYVVRNTPGVTGFIGSGTIPTPISEKEIKIILKRMQIEEPKYKIELSPGTPVRVMEGPFKSFEGKVDEVDEEKGRVKVLINVFGRETPVDLDFLQVKKI
ncbi:MAG: transcription termination/antitermination protein NusG [Patescibacteria group bacterium]|nr:transcription termination/antitermination protein NusG [Patescibacteria group bacterium]